MALRVLCIDDDQRLYALLARYLADAGVDLEHAPDGRQGLAAIERTPFDAVLLDVMMPGWDGLEVLRRLRARPGRPLPVIMLTARGDEADRVAGLEVGADDYVAKPFSPRELLARLRAVLRRSDGTPREALRAGDLEIDVAGRRVAAAGQAVELTALEFDLLVVLLRRRGRVLGRDALLAEAGRGDVAVSERTVDVHIAHLRRKLGEAPRQGGLIRTVRGFGYVLADEEP